MVHKSYGFFFFKSQKIQAGYIFTWFLHDFYKFNQYSKAYQNHHPFTTDGKPTATNGNHRLLLIKPRFCSHRPDGFWGFPKMGEYPIAGWFIREKTEIEMDDNLGYPHDLGNLYIYMKTIWR